jgi:transcriptional regulator with XRE-family HTH domain
MPTTGDRIREIREERKLTQDQLAEETGISKGFLSEVENNKRNVSSDYLLRIANALGASVDYILRGEQTNVLRNKTPIVIPPELSEAAEQLKLSYADALELLSAHESVLAKRSNRQTKRFTTEDWIALHNAIKKVFG